MDIYLSKFENWFSYGFLNFERWESVWDRLNRDLIRISMCEW
jgi:hypothetical protein